MTRNRIARCGCVLMAVMAVSSTLGWAQEPVVSDPVASVSHPAPIALSQPVENAADYETGKSGTGPWMIGTRILQFELQDDTRGTKFHDSFMGSITELKDEQDDSPNKVFVQYRLVESPFWIGVTYDHLRAAAWDEGGTDGSVDLSGCIPYLQARWENETRAVPYVELGLAYYEVDFEESSGWSNDGQRYVKLDDSVWGTDIAGGVSIRVYEGLSVDLYVRYMDVEDINGAYYINGSRDGDAIFTMSHTAYGLGVQYQF